VRRMAEDKPTPPLARRVPGATRSGPGSSARPVLPDAVMRRMQAAVDAARAARGDRTEPPEDADPSTGPSPGMHASSAEAVESVRRVGEGATDAGAFAGTTAGPDDPASPDPGAPPDRDASQDRPEVSSVFGQPRGTLATGAGTGREAGGKAAAGTGREAGGKAAAGTSRDAGGTAAAGTAAGRGPRVAVAAALVVVITAAASVTAVLLSRGSADRTDRTGQAGDQVAGQAAVSRRAAAWVASQVSHDARVACDKAMCDALTAQGFPGRHLQLIRPGSADPLRSDVVVVTPAVRRQFGGGLAAVWAPDALVSFGSGTAAITVRVIARQGAAAYQSALRADLRLRRVEGAGLLATGHVTATATARKQLMSGLVDARLIVVLTALASVHPVDIVAFGPPSAGASAGLPLRVADLAQTDRAAKLTRSDYVRFLLKVLHKQPAGYRPESAGPARAGDGRPVFRIEFTAPSPLGLLGPQRP
jgi:hypothetical protein